MVSFTPTEDQQLLIDTINRYATVDIRKTAHEHDEKSEPDLETIRKGWQIGLIPASIPETIGGFGEMSAVTSVLASEELAFGELSTAFHIMTPALFAYPLVLYGTQEQQSRYIEMFLDEDIAPATSALLEPGIGFDPHDMKTTATTDGDSITLNGTKAFVPLAESAEVMLVYAKDSESGDVSAYIVKKLADGVNIEKREMLLGIRALQTYRVKFNDVRVSADAKVDIDYNVILNRMRLGLASMAVGVARASHEYAVEYAKGRVQFGRAIAQNQSIAFMLAEGRIDIDAARLMVWEAAWKIDKGEDATREAVLAKQFADKMVLQVTDSGVQTLGGYGFIREYPAERWLRNGRGFTTFDGLTII
jgi:acyl-CoA dehydrogenase